MQILFALPFELWDHWFISPGSTSHHRDMGTIHISSFFITLPPLGPTCCDSIGSRLAAIVTMPYWRTDGWWLRLLAAAAISCQLQDPPFFLSFSFWFPFSSGAPLSDRPVSGNFKMAKPDRSALTGKKRWNESWREGVGPHGYSRRKTRYLQVGK